jgi:transcription elongation factor Elf1
MSPFRMLLLRVRSVLTRKDLSAGVDVYADWIDACDAVAKEAGPTQSGGRTGAPPRQAVTAGGGSDGGEGMDDFIENDELDAEGEFADDDD